MCQSSLKLYNKYPYHILAYNYLKVKMGFYRVSCFGMDMTIISQNSSYILGSYNFYFYKFAWYFINLWEIWNFPLEFLVFKMYYGNLLFITGHVCKKFLLIIWYNQTHFSLNFGKWMSKLRSTLFYSTTLPV